MKISLKASSPYSATLDMLGFFAGEDDFGEFTKNLPKEISTLVKAAFVHEEFTGKSDEMLLLSTGGNIPVYKLVFAGAGRRESIDLESIYDLIAKLIRKMR